MKRPTRVAIYARVSTTEQDPEAQLLALRAYAAQRGFEVYREYIDYVSGRMEMRTAPRQARDTAYHALMADVSRRTVDCVLVWKYDRLARSLSVLVGVHTTFVQKLSLTYYTDKCLGDSLFLFCVQYAETPDNYAYITHYLQNRPLG
jgi:hypothetical protein